MVNIANVIPAYNEEKTIKNVLSIVTAIDKLDEIVVVSDGSTDKTVEVAQSFGVKTIALDKNMGKGYAMKVGLENTVSPVILFLDADLIGLTKDHIYDLAFPVANNYVDMTLGVFKAGRGATDFAQKMTPFLTGQRAVKRWILEGLENEDWSNGFGIELALTIYAKQKKVDVMEIPLQNVSHYMKEEKMGITKGVAARFKMYWEIAKEMNRLQ